MADVKTEQDVAAEAAGVAVDGFAGDETVAPYVQRDADDIATLHLLVENIHCPNCIRQIEGAFEDVPDIVEARVNLTTRQLRLRWRGASERAEALVRRVQALGFIVVPFAPEDIGSAADGEAGRLLRSMAVAGFATANVMLLSVSVWAGAASDMGPATRTFLQWLSALIALPAVAYAGRPFFFSAWSAIRARSLNMDVPISVAVLLTAAMSLFETATGGAHTYFDACVTLLFILLIGRYLDRLARSRARNAAERLSVLDSGSARVIGEDGQLRQVPARQLKPGCWIAVAQGERIPADGHVIHGESEIDTSLLTGETLPRRVAAGDDVYAGTINLGAPLRLRVTATANGTVLAEIVRLMTAAEQNRSRYVRLADRAAQIYAPAVHVAALLAFLGWILVGGLGWQPALMIAVAVLIITCPCALGLAIPAVQVVASGRLMQAGVLVTQGDALERLAAADRVVFDKTGTLTTGKLSLVNRDEIGLRVGRLAAGIAAASRHPLCRALVDSFGPAIAVRDVAESPGQGLSAMIDGEQVRLGGRDWCGIGDDDPEPADGAGPELWLVRPGHAPVRFAFRDSLRPDAAATITALREAGLPVEILSGDREAVVRRIAKEVGIERWRAGCSPSDKAARLAELQAAGRRVLMVGDGLNDAPALAGAFVSVSPAAAADISRTAADLIIQGERLAPVVDAIRVARRARRLVRQNLAMAVAYNAVAVPLAAAGMVTPLIAAVAMSISSMSVTLNALRARLRDRRITV